MCLQDACIFIQLICTCMCMLPSIASPWTNAKAHSTHNTQNTHMHTNIMHTTHTHKCIMHTLHTCTYTYNARTTHIHIHTICTHTCTHRHACDHDPTAREEEHCLHVPEIMWCCHANHLLTPQPSLKLVLDLLPNEVQALVKWWFGLPLFTDADACPQCSQTLDIHGHHALKSQGITAFVTSSCLS